MGSRVHNLMNEWFTLKDEQTTMKKRRGLTTDTYFCSNMKPTKHNPYPTACVDRVMVKDDLPRDACENCKKRQQFVRDRKANASRRAAILAEVRQIVTPIKRKDKNA